MRAIYLAIVMLIGFLAPASAQEFGTTRPCRGSCTEFEPKAPDFNLCRQACNSDAQCKAWTYASKGYLGYKTNKCFIIPRVTDPIRNECCVSALKVVEDSDKADRCRDYSTAAINDAGENLRLRCGYTGDRWSTDRREHFKFCMGVNADARQREQNFRENKLDECRGGGDDSEAKLCNLFAREAVEQAQEARKLGCAVDGDRWSAVYTQQYNFCRIASKKERDAERDARIAKLKQCRIDSGNRDREDDCRDYAEEAVQQGGENTKLACGLDGSRWTAKYPDHFKWCLGVKKEVSDAERDARRRALKRCREDRADGDAERAQACRAYADEAAADQGENKRLACGYSGERWNSSAAYHYGWCMASSRAEREAANKARKGELARCRGTDTGGGADCKDYARASVRDWDENKRLGCGFDGGRWSPDPRAHFDYCRSVTEAAAKKQLAIRQELLAKCEAKPKRAANCRSFSNIAIAQQRQNLAKGCGFTGPRWHTDYELHWNWCMGVEGFIREIETIARQTALASCK